MLKKRIIVCLDVKDGRTTKGVKFKNNIDIGDPVEMAKKYYLIGNAHLDPVWLWRRSEGRGEVLQTFRSALDRLNEYGEFVFTCSSAAYYKWVEELDPAMFAEIRGRVKEGRWVPVGGLWVQPDCNLPSGESFARQAL